MEAAAWSFILLIFLCKRCLSLSPFSPTFVSSAALCHEGGKKILKNLLNNMGKVDKKLSGVHVNSMQHNVN